MPNTMREPQVSREVRTLDSIRPTQAKAGLASPTQSDRPTASEKSFGQELSKVIEETLMRHFGSVKAVAFALGEMDPSQLRREFETAKLPLARLEGLDAFTKAAVGTAIVEQFGILSDPKARARQVLRQLRALADELEQFIDVA